jgi:alkylation response protein AidB-like acyl-CoA dehydrogenase
VNALNVVDERCRQQKLTRNQHARFKLGELTAEAEVAMVFSEMAAGDDISDAFPYDKEMIKAMARIRARQAAHKVILEGVELVMGAGSGDASSMAEETELLKIISAQRGLVQDMDLVATKIREVFRAR